MQKSVNGKEVSSGNYFSQEENIVFPVGESVFPDACFLSLLYDFSRPHCTFVENNSQKTVICEK